MSAYKYKEIFLGVLDFNWECQNEIEDIIEHLNWLKELGVTHIDLQINLDDDIEPLYYKRIIDYNELKG